MARDGLSEQECAEILVELRRQCPKANDELLVWLADSFALEAPVDFDLNDLVSLLIRPERKIARRKRFPQDITPTEALEALLLDVGGEDGSEAGGSGGLLILRATAKRTNEYWSGSIGTVMGRFRQSVGPNGDAIYGVLVDEQIPAGFELFILISVSDTPKSDGMGY